MRELLERPDVASIAGHTAVRDESGDLVSISLDPTFDGPRFFVPDAQQPAPPTVLSIGQYANDLAIGGAEPARVVCVCVTRVRVRAYVRSMPPTRVYASISGSRFSPTRASRAPPYRQASSSLIQLTQVTRVRARPWRMRAIGATKL